MDVVEEVTPAVAPLDAEGVEEEAAEEDIDVVEEDAPACRGERRRRGAPCVLGLFPEVVDALSKFMAVNGFSAQLRRRNDTGRSVGVSVKQLTNHLLETVPGLKGYSAFLVPPSAVS